MGKGGEKICPVHGWTMEMDCYHTYVLQCTSGNPPSGESSRKDVVINFVWGEVVRVKNFWEFLDSGNWLSRLVKGPEGAREQYWRQRQRGLEKDGSVGMGTKCGSLWFGSVPTRPPTANSYTERLAPHPTEASEPLSSGTPAFAKQVHEWSGHDGRDTGYA